MRSKLQQCFIYNSNLLITYFSDYKSKEALELLISDQQNPIYPDVIDIIASHTKYKSDLIRGSVPYDLDTSRAKVVIEVLQKVDIPDDLLMRVIRRYDGFDSILQDEIDRCMNTKPFISFEYDRAYDAEGSELSMHIIGLDDEEEYIIRPTLCGHTRRPRSLRDCAERSHRVLGSPVRDTWYNNYFIKKGVLPTIQDLHSEHLYFVDHSRLILDAIANTDPSVTHIDFTKFGDDLVSVNGLVIPPHVTSIKFGFENNKLQTLDGLVASGVEDIDFQFSAVMRIGNAYLPNVKKVYAPNSYIGLDEIIQKFPRAEHIYIESNRWPGLSDFNALAGLETLTSLRELHFSDKLTSKEIREFIEKLDDSDEEKLVIRVRSIGSRRDRWGDISFRDRACFSYQRDIPEDLLRQKGVRLVCRR